MTANEFSQKMGELLTIDIDYFDNHKNFNEEYYGGKEFFHATLYIKRYREKQERHSFLIDEINVVPLKEACSEINKKIDALIKLVDEKNYYPNFARFYRSYWDLGYELSISFRSKFEDDKADAEAEAEDMARLNEFIAKNGYNPCEHCTDNCHRCRLGFRDDGAYSKYDVYSLNELL